MGNAGSGHRGRKHMAALLAEPGDARAARRMLRQYDRTGDGRLSWAEAKLYLADLLELSGEQANLIRQARETGEGNIARWYDNYLRELFQEMDGDGDGFVAIDDVVRPGSGDVARLLAAVTARLQAPAPGQQLVLSSKLKNDNSTVTAMLADPTSAPCRNECGFYGSAANYGYCEDCAALLAQSAAAPVPVYNLPPVPPPPAEVAGDNPYAAAAFFESPYTPPATTAHVEHNPYGGSGAATNIAGVNPYATPAAYANVAPATSDNPYLPVTDVAQQPSSPAPTAPDLTLSTSVGREVAPANASAAAAETATSPSTAADPAKKKMRRRRKKRAPPKEKGEAVPVKTDTVHDKNDNDTHDKGKSEDDWTNDSDNDDVASEDMEELIMEDFLEVSTHARHSKFSVLDGDQVEKLMDRKTKDASELLGLSQDEAALVLMYFNWNLGRLQERYFLDVDKYRRLAGVDLQGGGSVVRRADEESDCVICFDTVKPSETATLNCGDGPFCKACYQDYLKEKVRDHGAFTILSTPCMGQNCSLRLSPMQWRRLADPVDYKRYQYFYLKQFVESTSNLGFCPNPSCTKVVKYSGFGRPADVVECMCGKKYCFMCLEEAHNPVSCDQFKKWQAKNSQDDESLKFVLATSKQCPHCGLATERNEGCNHMECRVGVGGCGKGWCWMCRGDWATHGTKTGGYFSCNLYDKSKAKELDEAAGDLIKEAEYFQHFVDRFMNHGQLEKQSIDKREECITQWMVDYREETNGLDPTFILEALELLIRCRHTLKMTYVYAWFQDEAVRKARGESDGNKSSLLEKFQQNTGTGGSYGDQLQSRLLKLKRKQKKTPVAAANVASSSDLEMLETEQELFNFQQASLEGVTEELGELIFKQTKIIERADELKNLTAVTKRYLQNLISGFQDMMEDDDSW